PPRAAVPVTLSSSPAVVLASSFFFLVVRPPRLSPPFPYTTLFRSAVAHQLSMFEAIEVAALTEQLAERQHKPLQVFREFILRLRSEEHTSELQSRFDLVCRLLLEKKKADQRLDRSSPLGSRPQQTH